MALSDFWHKTLVYFGMADGEDDDYAPERGKQGSSRERERDRGEREGFDEIYGERPNVRRIGSRRRDDFDEIFREDEPLGAGARATPIRPVESPRQAMQVHLVVPKSFNDVQQVADKFKASVPVILNLQNAEMDLAKRLIDFTSGLTYALDGGMQRVADKVFMLTPRNVEVSAEERARLLEKGFFNQY